MLFPPCLCMHFPSLLSPLRMLSTPVLCLISSKTLNKEKKLFTLLINMILRFIVQLKYFKFAPISEVLRDIS